jgi:hypothetical protein
MKKPDNWIIDVEYFKKFNVQNWAHNIDEKMNELIFDLF